MTSTKVAYFEGIEKRYEAELHLSPDDTGSEDSRIDSVVAWLKHRDIQLSAIDGIACRSGFVRPAPSGTYKIVPNMLKDLEEPRLEHTSNMAIAIVTKLAELSGRKGDLLLTTSDPVVSDEIETVERRPASEDPPRRPGPHIQSQGGKAVVGRPHRKNLMR